MEHIPSLPWRLSLGRGFLKRKLADAHKEGSLHH